MGDVESSQHPEEVHAKLVNNEGLECQEQFKAHVTSVSDTLNPKILECQELKTNTKAVGLQEPLSFRQLITPSFRAVKCLVPGSPMRFQEHIRSSRTAGPVQIIRGAMLPQASPTQNATVCPHQGIVPDREVSPGVRTRESTMNVAAPASVKAFGFPRRKHVMPPRQCTPRRAPSGSSRPGSASVTPVSAVSGRSLSAVPALITPPTIQTTSSD